MFGQKYYYDYVSELPEDCGDYYVWKEGEEYEPMVMRIYEIEVKDIQTRAKFMAIFNRDVALDERVKMICFFSNYVPQLANPMPYEIYKRQHDLIKNEGAKALGLSEDTEATIKLQRFSKIPTFEIPMVN